MAGPAGWKTITLIKVIFLEFRYKFHSYLTGVPVFFFLSEMSLQSSAWTLCNCCIESVFVNETRLFLWSTVFIIYLQCNACAVKCANLNLMGHKYMSLKSKHMKTYIQIKMCGWPMLIFPQHTLTHTYETILHSITAPWQRDPPYTHDPPAILIDNQTEIPAERCVTIRLYVHFKGR